jgi:hypothetical protein
LRFPPVKTSALRLVIDEAKASPAIANIEVFAAREAPAAPGTHDEVGGGQ